MATLFDTLESALSGNALAGALSPGTGSLTGVSGVISGAGSKPPAGVAGFGPALRALSLPDLDVSSALGPGFASLKNALPSDLSSVTGGLTSGIDQLKASGTQLTDKLAESLKLVQAIYQLTQLDFGNGAAAGPPPAGGGGGGGAGSGGAGGAGTPAQPPLSAQSMSQVSAALDGLPSPFTVDSFLTWLQGTLADVNLDDFGMRQIMFIGELRDCLATLIGWKNADPAAIKAQLTDTLAHLDTLLQGLLDPVFMPLVASASDLAAKMHVAELAQVGDGIRASLEALKAPVAAGSLAGAGATITALTGLLDQYDQLKTTLQTDLAGVAGLQNALRDLPDALEDQMGRVVSRLRPSNSLAILDKAAADIQRDVAALKPFDDVQHFLGRLVAWIEDLLDSINFKAVVQPIEDAAGAMKSAGDGLDDATVGVTMQLQQVLSQVDAVLSLLDPAQATANVQTAVDAFKAQIGQKVAGLVTPAMSAVTQVVATIAQGVQAVDPDQLKAVLHDAIGKIADVIKDPRVAEVRADLDKAAQQLEAFSFAPLTGEVVKDMEKIADVLKSLGDLPAPLLDALHSAISVIPSDLKPITDPIVDEFGQIVSAGPVAALHAVADLPKQFADKVRAFDPTTLVGTSLSGPYNQLLTDMQGFKPSQLLDPVRQELEAFKDRLEDNVSPGNALKSLAAPFEELSKALDKLHPDEIIKPLDDKLKEALAGLSATIPLNDVFDQVDAALQPIKTALATAASAVAMLDKARGVLRGLADPQTQLDAWIAPVLAKLDNLGDTSAMQASLASVSASVDGVTATAIAAKRDPALAPVVAALGTLDPQARWTAVVQALRALTPAAVDALPASAQKNALKAALARLDPTQPPVTAPFRTLTALQQDIAQTKTALQTALAGWDAEFTAADTVLGSLRGLAPTPAHVKQWVQDAVTDELVHPLAAIFSLAAPALAMLDAVVGQLQALLTDVEAKVADLLDGVAALTSIRDTLQQLLDRIQNFNLDFLSSTLNGLFTALRAKLDAVNPASLGAALDAIFKDVLASLSVDLFLPPTDVAKLDADYAKVVDTLKALDPSTAVASLRQEECDKDVLPLIDAIDMSGPLHRIGDRLSSLTGELQTELDRVEDAFEAMLAAVPSGGGSGASGGLSL